MKTGIISLIAMATATALIGCDQRVEAPRRLCAELNSITDPVVKADLEKQCGRGGARFKPTPKTRDY